MFGTYHACSALEKICKSKLTSTHSVDELKANLEDEATLKAHYIGDRSVADLTIIEPAVHSVRTAI